MQFLGLIDHFIEFNNHFINFICFVKNRSPVVFVVIPLVVEFIQLPFLLFNPGEVLKVVNPLFVVVVKLNQVVNSLGVDHFNVHMGVLFRVGASLIGQLFKP